MSLTVSGHNCVGNPCIFCFPHGSTNAVQWSERACGYCGNLHTGLCPRVKTIEYYPNGTVKRVEFHHSAAPLTTEENA